MSVAALRRPSAAAAASAPIMSMSSGDLARACAAALHAAVANSDDPVGACAAAIGGNRRTAKNHYYAVNGADGMHLLRYMASLPGFAAEMARLTGGAEWWLPEFEAERAQTLARLGGAAGAGRGGRDG